MKIYVLPADAYACGYYRMIWPAQVLRSAGHDVIIIPPSRTRSGFPAHIQRQPDGRDVLVSVDVPMDADAVVIQRPAHVLQPEMINILRSNGIAVIIDMDDDMTTMHPQNGAYYTYRHGSKTSFSWKYASMSCQIATMVTVTTPQLLKTYAPHGRGRVIDNYVPRDYLGIPKSYSGGVFGWAGTTRSHPNDPQVTFPAVEKLISDGHPFHVVGGDPQVTSAFRLKHAPLMTGALPIEHWMPAVAMGLDVGLAPLAATTFNSAKSRLKPLEYMAAGVAWVASPRAEYRRLHRESGCGLLADNAKQWYEHTKNLLVNEALRQEQVDAGRAYLQDQTYEDNAWRWIEAWTDAVNFERSRVSGILRQRV